jgi:hypothetical protein
MAVISGSWERKITNAQERFKVLTEFNSEAVLDRETGLLWERKPSKEGMIWSTAKLFCAQKAVGGRGGWRLPAFNELTSLIDPTKTDTQMPRLPTGHPFLDVELDPLGPIAYWSATSLTGDPGFALAVHFFFVSTSNAPILVTDASTTGTSYLSWAVRGGSAGPDTY